MCNDAMDCATYISPSDLAAIGYKMERLQRAQMEAVGQSEVYDVLDVRNPTLVDDMIKEIKRLRAYIESIDRIYMRETNILYRLIEERTLILSDVDEIYNDYC